MNYLKRLLLRWALGKRKYEYMCRTLSQDPRLRSARLADIVVRKDGREVRIEADWLRDLCRLVEADLTPSVPQPDDDLSRTKVAEREAKKQRIIAEKRIKDNLKDYLLQGLNGSRKKLTEEDWQDIRNELNKIY